MIASLVRRSSDADQNHWIITILEDWSLGPGDHQICFITILTFNPRSALEQGPDEAQGSPNTT